MIKRTIKETIREYDKDGKVIRETITETSEYDNTAYCLTCPHGQPVTITNTPIRDTPDWIKVTCTNSATTNYEH